MRMRAKRSDKPIGSREGQCILLVDSKDDRSQR
jgi:hypothetical protein